MQRQSHGLCDLWWRYCEANAHGWRDPKLHSLRFLRTFFSEAEIGTARGERGYTGSVQSWWHQDLVEQVKTGQRRSHAFKCEWWTLSETMSEIQASTMSTSSKIF
ncbi:Hypothetical protein SCF082_LOCUS30122 [Durusdinium trenchii]|uniref:Uncharacterized protein n=1 Tax=Durusdinium trenchii TaxID=1381693 RepID=A0ABP0MWM6_9DINO